MARARAIAAGASVTARSDRAHRRGDRADPAGAVHDDDGASGAAAQTPTPVSPGEVDIQAPVTLTVAIK